MRRIVIGQPVVEWVAKQTSDYGNFGAAVGFGVERDGALVAGIVFNEFNGANMNFHVASDGSRNWMNRTLLWIVFDYAFNQAKVKRLTGLIGSGNVASQEFARHIGGKLEAVLEDAHPDGELFVYRMFRRECRWLNMRKPRELLKAA